MKKQTPERWINQLKKDAARLGIEIKGKPSRKKSLQVLNEIYKEFRTSKMPRQEDAYKLRMISKALNEKYGYDIKIDEAVFNKPFKLACPYCGKVASYVSASMVYGKNVSGMRYFCKDCDAHVGVHAGTSIPLGTLANAELRERRKQAHAIFDKLWMGRSNDCRKHMYEALSAYMGIPLSETHIGSFNMEQCKIVEQFYDEVMK